MCTPLNLNSAATALPRIASDFQAFSQQGWVSSAFILTQTAFLLLFGQILRVWPAKWVLIASATLFEVGSAICGWSGNVNVLIWGRAVSGVGAAGLCEYISSWPRVIEFALTHWRLRSHVHPPGFDASHVTPGSTRIHG